MPLKLNIVIASTRPGRVGPAVAEWFHAAAREHAGFEVELVDLQEFDLPVYNEPKHPRLQDYLHDHTKKWSASVASADAFAFVTPEYNFGPTPALLNALNYVFREWNYKPCGFISYGGVSGGLRAVQLTKQVVTTLKMMPVPEAVTIPMVAQALKDGVFQPNDLHRDSAKMLLDELGKWAGALAPLRQG